jgi:hypothetical protein
MGISLFYGDELLAMANSQVQHRGSQRDVANPAAASCGADDIVTIGLETSKPQE